MNKSNIVNKLIEYLINENSEYKNIKVPNEYREKRMLLKGLINIREPKVIKNEILDLEDKLLQIELNEKGIIEVDSLTSEENNIYLWQGDITTINATAIVNAGNNAGLGCFAPDHYCIDNVIHTNAGIRLRLECNAILKGNYIENGEIIVSEAYNLPSKKVITTVGPQINNNVTTKDKEELSNCYKNSLLYAIENNYSSIVFPCISTGLFSFPMSIAKEIAYTSVKDVLKDNDIKVIFNVFSKEDYDEYKSMFKNK